MSKTANEYLESLFEGITTIVDKRLQGVSYDSTVICTVIDDSNSKNGSYKVTDGTISYMAFADSDKYINGDQVRVSVPMGDFTQNKFIVGKYVTDNDSNPITYTSPAESILNISGNLTSNISGGIVANGDKAIDVIWNRTLDNDFQAMQNNNIYNTIVLQADFKTLLSNYDLVAGNYGLRLDLSVKPSANSSLSIRRIIELDSSEMFGNPYSFMIDSHQAKVIKLDTIGIIENIALSIYQKGNFINRNGKLITPINKNDCNILVKNVSLSLGCDLNLVEDNKLQIYTQNELTYKYHPHSDETNLKTINLLWINKDDNNKYIGFSDGIYDHDYDELQYLSVSQVEQRLINQQGKENIPGDRTSLTLAANIAEAKVGIENALKVITTNLIPTLQEMSLYLGDSTYRDNVNKLLNAQDERCLNNIVTNIKTYLGQEGGSKGMIPQYAAVLKYGYETWKGESHTEEWIRSVDNDLWPNTLETDSSKYEERNNYNQLIRQGFNNIKNNVNWLLNSGFNNIDSSGYKSVYDTYSTRIIRILATALGHIGKAAEYNADYSYLNKSFPESVLKASGSDFGTLTQYYNKTQSSFTLYRAPNLSEYDNRYCIYWYRWEKDYIPPDTEQIMPNGWRRLTAADFESPHSAADNDKINIGLSAQYKDENNQPVRNSDGKYVHAPKPASNKGYFSRYMQFDSTEEKYIAVLFYNHQMYKSNELVFTNADVVPDKATLDSGDILTFEHFENSTDSFNVYSVTNYLMDSSDSTKTRRIRCHYDGLLAKDNAFINGYIYWYIPGVSTLLDIDMDYLLNEQGFVLDTNRTVYSYNPVTLTSSQYSSSKYYTRSNNVYSLATGTYASNTQYYERFCSKYCFYKQITATKKPDADNEVYEWDKYDYTTDDIDNRDFWYKIKPFYESSASNNDISCEFIPANSVDAVRGTQLFTFGIQGTSGTRYTLKIVPSSSRKAIGGENGLGLQVELKDFNNESLPLSNAKNLNFEWIGYSTTRAAAENGNGVIDQNPSSSTEMSKNFTTPKGCFGVFKASANVTLVGTTLAGVENGPDITDADDATSVGKTRSVDLEVLCSVPCCGYIDNDKVSHYDDAFFMQGPTEIYYNSLGTIDDQSMFATPYRLFAKKRVTVGGQVYQKDTQINDIVWSIEYYKINNDSLLETLNKNDANNKIYLQYLPKLQNGNLIPAPMYIEGMNDCLAVVVAKRGTAYLWRQPIIIMQGRFGSSVLNNWDGSLTIDEKNGTILSSMVGAGRKTDNNTFEGVLMGNVALGTASGTGFEQGNAIGLSNQTGLGLYGFNDGAQSFGFNIDGTAFLGKSGSGRIIFNGNAGTIASSKWYTSGGQINSNPTPENPSSISSAGTEGMCIDLESGHIDAYNFKLTSGNIYLNSNPSDGHVQNTTIRDPYKNYYLRIGNENKTGYIGLNSDGELEIRVNSLQITGTLGNENLFKQTSPRQTILVPHWHNIVRVISSEEQTDDDGNVTVNHTTETIYKESQYPENSTNPVYTYDVSAWNKRKYDSGYKTISTSKWQPSTTTYAANSCVIATVFGKTNTYMGNIWINTSGSTIPAGQNPPANNSFWTPYIGVNSSDADKPYILDIYGSDTAISQEIELKANREYTVSGYCKLSNTPSSEKTFSILIEGGTVVYSNLDYTINYESKKSYSINDTDWHYFRCTFKNGAKDKRTIGFTCNAPFQLWHLKLEEGSVATAWCPAPDDVEANTESVKNKYDVYLAQDQVFEKLFKDSKTGLMADGIVMLPAGDTLSGRPELFISASYMATGILRSKNWDGELKAAYDANTDSYRYTIKREPNSGMYINLDEGKIWAATFELNAWDYSNSTQGSGLYLNSDPDLEYFDANGNINTDRNYYLKLGDLEKGYITFDALGNLNMRVNSFELTGTFGGTNLLNDTAPRGAFGQYIRNARLSDPPTGAHWKYNEGSMEEDEWIKKNIIAIVDDSDEKGRSIKLYNGPALAANYRHIYQEIEPLRNADKYILSGWVNVPAILKDIKFRIRSDTTSEISEGKYVVWTYSPTEPGWHYISHIFNIEEKEKEKNIKFNEPRFEILDYNLTTFNNNTNKTIKAENSTCFHHLKLEQGTVATQWEESEQDKLDTLDVYDTEQLLQDAIFDKLTDGGTSKGIFLKDKQLYINATYLASSIIRSSNWQAQYELQNSNGETITNSSGGTKFTQANLQQVLELYPDAKIVNIKPTAGMYINLDDGKIWAKNFELDAMETSTKGLYLNNNPVAPESADAALTKNNYYFRMGSSNSNYIGYAKTKVKNAEGEESESSSFIIKSKTFNLQTGTSGKAGYISINSDASKDSDGEYNVKPLVIGKNFSVDWNGNLVVNGATFNGKITSNSTIESATITGGTISGTSIIGTGIYARAEGSTNNTFAVDGTTGHMTCNSATIGGWTVDPDSISGNGITMSGTEGISSSYWNVGENGVTTITDLKVTNSLTVSWAPSSKAGRAAVTPDHVGGGGNTGGEDSTPTAMVSIAGGTSIGGDTSIGGTLTISGNTDISGTVTIGTTDSNTSLTINGTNTITGDTSIGGDLTVPSGDHIYLASGGGDDGKSGITLLEYIKNNSDSLIDFSLFGGDKTVVDLGSLFGKSTAAGALANSSGTITASAPSSAPSEAGLFLKSTSSTTTAGTTWSTIAPSDISHTEDNNGQVLGVTNGSAKWLTLGDLAYKDSITASLVNFSNTTVTADPDSGAGVYKISITDPVTIPTYSSVTVYLYTKTQPGGGYFQTSETTDSNDIPAGAYWTKITRNIVTSTTSTSNKTFTGQVKVSVSAT